MFNTMPVNYDNWKTTASNLDACLPKLDNCPCCGSTDVGFEGDDSIMCYDCALSMPKKIDDEATAKAWNRRPDPYILR